MCVLNVSLVNQKINSTIDKHHSNEVNVGTSSCIFLAGHPCDTPKPIHQIAQPCQSKYLLCLTKIIKGKRNNNTGYRNEITGNPSTGNHTYLWGMGLWAAPR